LLTNLGPSPCWSENRQTGHFHDALVRILDVLGIPYELLDTRGKTGAPDLLLKLPDCPPVVMELKSRLSDLVDYNDATEVLAASEVHGYRDAFCVTLCHPGVEPSVAPVVASCGRLSVVESHDLGEALLRFCERVLTARQLWQWLATPGQALAADLPFGQL
jgi:helicase